MSASIRISRPNESSWQEAFALDDSLLSDWEAESDPSLGVLFWALGNNRLVVSDYLAWAHRRYQIPLLQTQFTDILPSEEFYRKVADAGNWSKTKVPLIEWEGTLFVGVVDPEIEVLCNSAFVKILVHPQDMLKIYDKFQKQTGAQPAAAETFDMPEGLTIPLTPNVHTSTIPIDKSDFGFDAPEGFSNSDIKLPDAPTAKLSGAKLPDLPENLTVNITSPNLGEKSSKTKGPERQPLFARFNSGTKTPSLAKTDPRVESPKFAEAENTFGNAEAQTLVKSHAPPSPAFQFKRQQEDDDEPQTGSFRLDGLTSSQPKIQLAEDPEVTQSGPTPKDDLLKQKTLLGVTRLTISKSTNQQEGFVYTTGVELIPMDACLSYDQLGAVGIVQALKYFEHTMLLMFRNNELKPWRWSDHWKPVFAEKILAIDLTKPSIFRVVYKTGLPYHGHVVANDLNQRFFNEWNRGQVPLHATIAPIEVGERIAGMILGLNNERRLSAEEMRACLKVMERLAEDLSTNFERLKTKAPAA